MNILRDLEIELHQFDARRNETRLDELLHNSFVEFGRSGTRYNKADIRGQIRRFHAIAQTPDSGMTRESRATPSTIGIIVRYVSESIKARNDSVSWSFLSL